VIAVFEAAFEDGEGQRVEEVLLDGAFEGPRAEDGIEVGVVGKVAGGVVGDSEVDVLLREAFDDALELDFDDLIKLRGVETVEDDDLVDAVEELGTEELLQAVAHQGAARPSVMVIHFVITTAALLLMRRAFRTQSFFLHSVTGLQNDRPWLPPRHPPSSVV
jgi:hypothetical protein